MIEHRDAERLDAQDPLARFRERFVLGGPETLYLDGNSLGRLPLATQTELHERIEQWGADVVTGWHDWIDLPERAGDLLADAALGARPGEVIVADSTTVNLFKLAAAVLETREGAIVTDRANFPTDRYVLDGLAQRHGRELVCFDVDPVEGPQAADVRRACAGVEIALVCLSACRLPLGCAGGRRAHHRRDQRSTDMGPEPLGRRRADRPERVGR